MLKRFFIIMTLGLALVSSTSLAQTPQSTPTQTTRTRTTTTSTITPQSAAPQSTRTGDANSQKTTTTGAMPPPSRARTAAARRAATDVETDTARQEPGAREVLVAFDALVEGIERADVNAVTNAYWNSPQLVLFNYNGTTTKTWEQLQKNRASSYPLMKDVRLDIRDRHVQMLAPNAALVTCLWKQSQTFRGVPDTASGRMTLVYRRVGNVWKIFHLHTSPDTPDPSRIPASEQTPAATTNASPQPAAVRSKPAP